MIIDWKAAPEGTTHATIPNGDPRWYKLEGGKVFCWGVSFKNWAPSFFLTVDEIAEAGLTIYANGEQSELVMLRERIKRLENAKATLESAASGILEVSNKPNSTYSIIRVAKYELELALERSRRVI